MVDAMSTAPTRIRRRPGWLRVITTSAAMFLVVLALLAVRVSAGQDPVLAAQASSAAQTTSTSTDTESTTSSEETTSSSSSDVPTTQAS